MSCVDSHFFTPTGSVISLADLGEKRDQQQKKGGGEGGESEQTKNPLILWTVSLQVGGKRGSRTKRERGGGRKGIDCRPFLFPYGLCRERGGRGKIREGGERQIRKPSRITPSLDKNLSCCPRKEEKGGISGEEKEREIGQASPLVLCDRLHITSTFQKKKAPKGKEDTCRRPALKILIMSSLLSIEK